MNDSPPSTAGKVSGVEACECWKCHKPTPRLNYCVWCGNFLLSTTKTMTVEEVKERMNVQTRDRSTQSDFDGMTGKAEPSTGAAEGSEGEGAKTEESTKKQRVNE
ncbi:hypothetical protein FOZ63_010103 [Perkinsus olseni]|uniref:Uncharacterized protein n=1 Tax=Perkinsus olseni TaxID=32597 RepID=A0A7J6RUX5_PEROL|nr:hypothetical protein FOZ63_010103 [Perkinsus olseni]